MSGIDIAALDQDQAVAYLAEHWNLTEDMARWRWRWDLESMNGQTASELDVTAASDPGQEAVVTPPNLIDDLEYQFRRFLAMDTGLSLVLALWSLATHNYSCFDAFPYLGITSPTKRCGKTRAAEALELFCARPLRTVGMTQAVLFRSIEQDKPTLMVDEAESLRGSDERSNALREILNVGYRAGQKVRRCEGKNFDLRDFETYCPKVLVLIGNLPDTLADRTIPIRMRRRSAGETVDRFILTKVKADTAPLRAECERWATAHQPQVVTAYHETGDVPFLEDREAELWMPLFAVCQIVAPHRLKELEAVARRLAGAKGADVPRDLGIQLLTDVRDIFAKVRPANRIRTADLLYAVNKIEGSPWPCYSHGRPLDAHSLGELLHPFGISPQNIRLGTIVAKGYTLASFDEAFTRYLAPRSATPLQGP